ncbi:MAG: hypothetical protein ACQEP5_00045 [Actinomycetota bacterium]
MSKRICTRKLFFVIIILISMLFLGLSACAQPEKTDIDIGPEETPQEEEAGEELAEEEIIDVIEEEVDYENAAVGAEMEGFIPSYLCTEKDNYIKINITNTSDFTWRKDGENMVRIGYHYYHSEEGKESYDNPTRTQLPENVAPQETVTVEVLVNNIDTSGNYTLRIDPVLEGQFWFSSRGVEMLEGTAYFGPCSN